MSLFRQLSERHPVARKEHECIRCAVPIHVGEKYFVRADILDGEFQLSKFHQECWDKWWVVGEPVEEEA